MYGIIILSLLLICFSYGIIRILKSNRKIRCGCYGVLLDAEVDSFTLGKNIYLFLLLGLVLIGIMIPITPHYSIYSVGTGLIITLISFLTQKLWSIHRDAMNHLES